MKISSSLQNVPDDVRSLLLYPSRPDTDGGRFCPWKRKKKKKEEKGGKKRKIRDLTATIYTKERCCKARRKCTTPWMAFTRIYFYTVKTFVVAFVDESILFQVPPLLSSFVFFQSSPTSRPHYFNFPPRIYVYSGSGARTIPRLYTWIPLPFLFAVVKEKIEGVPRLLSWSSTTTADIMKTLPTLPATAREASRRSRATLDQADDSVTGETSRSLSMTLVIVFPISDSRALVVTV